MPLLSVVIVSYQVRDLLARCLRSLEAPGGAPAGTEVFVVDNASTDGSADLIEAEFPSVHVIWNKENRGFAAANNQALQIALGRYLLLLNPDTEVRPGALGTLVEFMEGHPRAGVCGARLKYGDGSFQHSAFHFPTLAQVYLDFFPTHHRLTESRLNGRYPRAQYDRGIPFQIDHPLGACLLARRKAVEQVGWLDEQFFIYAEEVDWCIRFKRAGWEIWCVPSAEVVHHEGRSTSQFRGPMFFELWKARLRLFHKHYDPTFNQVVRWIVKAGLAYKIREARSTQPAAVETYRRVWAMVSQPTPP